MITIKYKKLAYFESLSYQDYILPVQIKTHPATSHNQYKVNVPTWGQIALVAAWSPECGDTVLSMNAWAAWGCPGLPRQEAWGYFLLETQFGTAQPRPMGKKDGMMKTHFTEEETEMWSWFSLSEVSELPRGGRKPNTEA